jgi:hypothetical protein
MTAPGNQYLVIILTLGILLSSAYAVGRIHEWHRHGVKRDEAYRVGYDQASHTLIGLMETKGPSGVPPTEAGIAPGDRLNSRRMGRTARGASPGHTYHPQPQSRQRQSR